jgi:peptidoglycan/LPS O-acetylase OafA/YrhL
MNAIPALDGLRALAVLLVVLFHAWTFVPGYIQPGQNAANYALFYGKTGVQLFFVLSGFLLFLPYAQWVFGLRERPSTLMFYKRRALRVGPAYWVSLVILILTAPLTFAALRDLAVHLVFLSNTSWQTAFSINGVYWTMAIEVQFYALLPAIAWAMRALALKIGALRSMLLMFCLLVLISLISHALGNIAALGTIPVFSTFLINYSSMPYWLAVFGCGIACSMIYTYLIRTARLKRRQVRRIPGICTRLFVLGVLLALALAFVPLLHKLFVLDLLFGLAYAGMLMGVLFGASILRKPFESRAMRFVGLISYSFYIWHRVVLHVLSSRVYVVARVVLRLVGQHHAIVATAAQVAVLFILGTLASAVVAYLPYQALERPFINVRKKSHETTAPSPLSLGYPQVAQQVD